MTEEEVLAVVADNIRRVFNPGEIAITRATTANEVDGWDSLAHTIFILRLEKSLNVRIPDGAAARFANVGELVDLLTRLKAAG